MSTAQANKSNMFDPAALVHTLQALLPAQAQSSGGSDDTAAAGQVDQKALLANPHDALAALAHTIMTAVGFRLIGLGEDHRLPLPAASSSSADSAPTEQPDSNRLPPEWNARGPESYAFRYRHNQSAMEFVLKVVRMGGRALIHALAIEDNKTATLDVQVDDYTSASFFPYPRSSSSSSTSAGSGSASSEPLIHGFIGSARVQDLTSLFKINIIQKLVPGLQKEGYYEESTSTSAGAGGGDAGPSGSGNRNRPPPPRAPEYDPLMDPRFIPPPARPYRPGRGDEDDDDNFPRFDPFGSGIGAGPGRNPATIGDRDLDPLGIPPGRFGGGPPPLFGGGGRDQGGGMIVGPDHPLFRDRFGPGDGRGGNGGTGGLPAGAVPPGARFDPIGPFGPGPGVGPGSGPRRPPRGGPLGGDPDWDDLPPPRNSDYDNMFM
ncbi:hypothetical protein OC842_001475 [Tilletia horrida]|uniref:Proteasome inhibitor PI31 subunit n=1 Tax=Tilletia horrida TaxID=155126 RepID=A0AAN6JT45_9BASI|nr:hypothetical protein OC842_001475 [Tilletia horrida]